MALLLEGEGNKAFYAFWYFNIEYFQSVNIKFKSLI
jgi:hypothetical protein